MASADRVETQRTGAWGRLAVVTVTLLGLGLGLAFLRTGRNLVVPIVAHGLLDGVGLTELFLAN